jgi:prepilin-type N-terminal cleavage/methylation domain-containing protein
MRGTTLIELLVALLLAGIAATGAVAAMAHLQRAWHDADLQSRMHERAQYVFSTLEPELQMAGYFGRGSPPRLGDASIAAAPTACGASVVLPLLPAVQVQRGAWPLPCPAQGGGVIPGNDVLLVRRASIHVAAAGSSALRLAASPAAPEIRELIVRIYYIARTADGDASTPALRVKSLSAIAGTPAFIDTEVMPGVDGLQVDLLPDSTAPRTVRIRLRIRADAAASRGSTLPALDIERRFTLRNSAS